MELFDKFSNNNPKPMDAAFNGSDYVDKRDRRRLAGQILRVHDCMIDGNRDLESLSLPSNREATRRMAFTSTKF